MNNKRDIYKDYFIKISFKINIVQRFIIVVIAIAILLSQECSFGMTIFEQSLTANDRQLILSEVETQEVADQFLLNEHANVTGVKWYGSYFSYDLDNSIHSINFVIRFYTDMNHSPSAVHFFEEAVLANVMDSGLTNDARIIYGFEAELQMPVLLLGNETYWISIREADARTTPPGGAIPNFGFEWTPSSSAVGDTFAFRSRFTDWAIQSGEFGDNNLAFSLTGSSPVPLPTSCWLFGSGLLVLAGITRKYKQRKMSEVDCSEGHTTLSIRAVCEE